MLASTAGRVLAWYFRSRARLDAPVTLQVDENAAGYLALSGRARETLLVETATVALALARISERDRLILVTRHDPEQGGLTDLELAQALHTDRDGARGAHTAALVALGEQLVRMRLIYCNGKPKWGECAQRG